MPGIIILVLVLFVVNTIDPKDLVPPVSLLGCVGAALAVGLGVFLAVVSGSLAFGCIVGIVGLCAVLLADDCE